MKKVLPVFVCLINSVSDPYSLNPDPAKNLNPDPVPDPNPNYFLPLSEIERQNVVMSLKKLKECCKCH